VDVVFTLQPGDGTAVDTGTTNTNTADFATGAFNPTTVTIPAGSKTATFNVVAVNRRQDRTAGELQRQG